MELVALTFVDTVTQHQRSSGTLQPVDGLTVYNQIPTARICLHNRKITWFGKESRTYVARWKVEEGNACIQWSAILCI